MLSTNFCIQIKIMKEKEISLWDELWIKEHKLNEILVSSGLKKVTAQAWKDMDRLLRNATFDPFVVSA